MTDELPAIETLDDELVSVPVPRRLLGEVYALLAQHMRPSQQALASGRSVSSVDAAAVTVSDAIELRDSVHFEVIRGGTAPQWVYKGDAVTVPGQGTWTVGMLTVLATELSPYRAVSRALDKIALVSPDAVDFDFLRHAVAMDLGENVSANQLRSEFGTLTRVARRLFDSKNWPVISKQVGPGNRVFYSMPPRIAGWWREIREDLLAQRQQGGPNG